MIYRIEVLNWTKHNVRNDVKRHHWFKVDNRIYEDPFFVEHTSPDILATWLYILCKASQQQPNKIIKISDRRLMLDIGVPEGRLEDIILMLQCDGKIGSVTCAHAEEMLFDKPGVPKKINKQNHDHHTSVTDPYKSVNQENEYEKEDDNEKEKDSVEIRSGASQATDSVGDDNILKFNHVDDAKITALTKIDSDRRTHSDEGMYSGAHQLTQSWLVFASEGQPWVKHNPQSFVNAMRRVLKSTKLDVEQLTAVFEWAKKDSFWSDKIFSLPGLLKKSKSNDQRKIDNLLNAFGRPLRAANRQRDEIEKFVRGDVDLSTYGIGV